MDAQIIAAAEGWLEEHTGLAAGERRALAAMSPRLASDLPDNRPIVVGIAGPPGTGKSTLAGMMCAALAVDGRNAMTLSLDDYYLPAMYRQAIANNIHSLFAVRGVPGTHDLDLLLAHLDAITGGAISVFLPEFDKSADDRLPDPEPVRLPTPLHCLFLEGWCIGAPAQVQGKLRKPVNNLEETEDRDGSWRKAVNQQARRYHDLLGPRLHRRWFLSAPDWDCVVDWRWRQEQEIDPEHRLLESHGQVMDFLANYERLCRHMLATSNSWADLIIELSPGHRPSEVRQL